MLTYIKKTIRRFKRWMSFNPPGALTSDGWNSFNEEFYLKAPIRYWFDNDFRKIFIYPVKWKYREITDWFRYRIYDRYHVVKTGLPPGYNEVDNTMLHVNFNYLKILLKFNRLHANTGPTRFLKRGVSNICRFIGYFIHLGDPT